MLIRLASACSILSVEKVGHSFSAALFYKFPFCFVLLDSVLFYFFLFQSAFLFFPRLFFSFCGRDPVPTVCMGLYPKKSGKSRWKNSAKGRFCGRDPCKIPSLHQKEFFLLPNEPAQSQCQTPADKYAAPPIPAD